jgi:dCMP deaminase
MKNKLERTIKKIEIFEDILKTISSLSTSTSLKVACIAFQRNFKNIAAFGYNGSYKNASINSETGTEEESLEPGKSGFVHAEMNMIAKFREHNPENYVIFLTHSPCTVCAKLLINADFKFVYWLTEYRETAHLEKYFENNLIGYGKIEDLKRENILLEKTFKVF